MIDAGMCLGEGCGAAALFPLLDMAGEVYSRMATFQEMQVEQYERFERGTWGMIYLVTGGSGSGKSAYGERLILSFGEGQRIYIATMDPERERKAERGLRATEGCGRGKGVYNH